MFVREHDAVVLSQAASFLNAMVTATNVRTALLVFVGGVMGSAASWAVRAVVVSLGVSGHAGLALVNCAGAFALAWLAGAAPSRFAGRRKLLWGTGFLGAFTTYGGIAATTLDHPLWVPVHVGAGVASAAVGYAVGAKMRAPR